MFLKSIDSIFTIIIMIMVGYYFTNTGWFNEATSKIFSKIVMNISLPCYMVYNLTSTFDRSKLGSLSKSLLIPVISMGASYILSIIVSHAIKVDRKRTGVFRTMFFVSNTMFIGLPVNLALFGDSGIPYVLLYYIANTCFYWTLGVYEISKDNPMNKSISLFNIKTLKHILNPALIGFTIGILLILFNIHLPRCILESSKYIGNLTTPLAMFFTGIVLYSVKLKEIKFTSDVIVLIIARSLVCPMLVLFLIHIFPVPKLMGMVFIVQAAMPAITSTGVVAKEYGSDYEFATIITVITTITSLFIIPIYMHFIAV